MGTMAQIAATTTLMNTITQSTRPTVSSGTGTSAGGIWDSIKQDLQGNLKDKGKRPSRDPGSGGTPGGNPGGGGDPGDGRGGGNPGVGPAPAPIGGEAVSDCLKGNKPEIYDGD